MWIKRKPKNRRLDRGHVLEVKLRSSQVRSARLRMIVLGVAASVATVAGLILIWYGGQWALERLVYQNKAFALETIDIQTDGIVATEQLRRWARVKPGDNLIALDLARVQRDLLLVPLLESASIERVLPHTLRIRVTEREAVAQANMPRLRPGGGLELAPLQIDAQGYVMQPLEPSQRAAPQNQVTEQLTILTGIDPRDLQPGRRIESAQVRAALDLIVAFDRSPMAGLVDIRHIDVSGPQVLVADCSPGSEVIFSRGDLDRQLLRWREIYDRGQQAGRAIASLDLAVSNNIPARWLDAATLPQNSAKPFKPLHLRKKHV